MSAAATRFCCSREGAGFSGADTASTPYPLPGGMCGLHPYYVTATTIGLAGAMGLATAVGELHLRATSLSCLHLASPTHSNTPTFRCTNVWLSQAW